MSNISAVIVSCQKSNYHRVITEQAIKSSGVECIVIETNPQAKPYDCQTLFWTKEFNYNKCLNWGIEHTNTEYIALCNNDLVFEKGWEKITDVMGHFELLSASPYSKYNPHPQPYKQGNEIHYGYQIGWEMLGWCIVINRELLQTIKKLDETYKFWCSDNAYADQLKANGIKHAVVCNSIVNHIGGGSKTLNSLRNNSAQKYFDLTINEYNRYAEKQRNIKANTYNIPEEL
jgi:GT2 family glycosyltransferase